MKNAPLATSLVLSLLAFGSPALAAPTVTDGSFETPSPAALYGDPATMFSGGAGIEANNGPFGYANAPDGVQVAHVQQGGIVTLQVNGLNPGTNYIVDFLAAARPNYVNLPITVAFDGLDIGTFTATSTAFSPFAYRFSFPDEDTNSGTLTFTGLDGAGDLNAAIDNVTVAAVPEPATWAMMMLGFGMIGFGLRRRSKVTASVKFA